MQLSDDRTQATLAINKTLTAPELENLIRELATLRSQMTPEATPTPKDENGAGVPVMTQDNPTLAIKYPLEDAHVTVYLRSLGLGWTAWRLHPQFGQVASNDQQCPGCQRAGSAPDRAGGQPGQGR